MDGRPIRFFDDAETARLIAAFFATPPAQGARVYEVAGKLVYDTRTDPVIAQDTERYLAAAQARMHHPLPEPDAA